MIIKQLKLKNFGKFKEKTIDLHPNLSFVYGKGDSGKTTLLAFIRCMLYGMSQEDERYIPINERTCGGTITFEMDGRIYLVERDFVAKNIHVVDVKANQIVDNPESVMEAITADITREDFDFVFGLRKQKMTYKDIDSLCNYANEVQETISGNHWDEQLEHIKLEILKCKEKIVDQAQADYDAWKKEVLQQQEIVREQQQFLKEQNQNLEEQNKKKQDAELAVDTQSKKLSEPIEQLKQSIEEQQQQLEQLELRLKQKKLTERPAVYCLMVFLIGLLGLATYMLVTQKMVLLIAAIGLSIIGLIGYIAFSVRYNYYVRDWNKRLVVKDKLKKDKVNLEECAKQFSVVEKDCAQEKESYNKMQQEVEELYLHYIEEKNKLKQLENILNEKAEVLRQNDFNRNEVNALTEKHQMLCESRKAQKEQTEHMLMKLASRYLGAFTDSKYDMLSMDEKRKVTLSMDGKVYKLEYMGQSTIALCVFAIQLAVVDVVWKSHTIPIIMDETVGDFDDKYIKNIIEVLKKNPRQVILLSGHQNCLDYMKQ